MKRKTLVLCAAMLIFAVLAGIANGAGRLATSSPSSDTHALNKPPLRVAMLLPLTGPGADGAAYSKEGFELALDEIRAEGGKIELLYEDTQTTPKTAVTIYQRLQTLSDPPKVIVPQLSSVMKALQPLLKGDNLTVCTGVSTPGVTDINKRIFRVFLSAEGIGQFAANWSIIKGAKSVTVVYVNDEYGLLTLQSFRKVFETEGRVVTAEPFSLIEKDFRVQWQRLLKNNPDGLFIAGYGPGYVAVLNQLRVLDYSGIIITDWSLTAPEYFSATQGIREGAYVVSVPPALRFVEKYQNKFHKQGSLLNAGFSFDTLILIWKAYQSSDGTPQGMSKAILKMKKYPGLMPVKGFDDTGDIKISYSVLEVRNGSLVSPEK